MQIYKEIYIYIYIYIYISRCVSRGRGGPRCPLDSPLRPLTLSLEAFFSNEDEPSSCKRGDERTTKEERRGEAEDSPGGPGERKEGRKERRRRDGLIEAGMMFNSKKLKTRPANYGASRAINPGEEDWTEEEGGRGQGEEGEAWGERKGRGKTS